MTVAITNLQAKLRVKWSAREWVAKENLKIEASSEKETAFHQASLVTQATASALAEEFNDVVKALRVRPTPAPTAPPVRPNSPPHPAHSSRRSCPRFNSSRSSST